MVGNRCQRCDAELESEEQFGLCSRCSLEELLDIDELGDDSDTRFGSNPGKREGTVIAGYQVLEKIAQGGMGVVYKAMDPKLNRIVALKLVHHSLVFSPQSEARFRFEAETVAQLDHPNIVPILDVGQEDGAPYFTMKLIEGGTLSEWVKGKSKFPALELQDPKRQKYSARLISKICQAVHHAHEHGILHRDLKPSNILLNLEGEPFVTDFGLAKRLDQDMELTVSGTVVGTPEYMSPEQASGSSQGLTIASDIYSLGSLLFYLLTGQPPFTGDSVLAIAAQVRESHAPELSAINRLIDRDLALICQRAMEKDPDCRYATAEELSLDLERWLNGEPILAREATSLERFKKWTQRNPTIAGLSALIAISMIALTIVSVIGERRASRLASEKANESRKALEAQAEAELANSTLNTNLVRLEFESAQKALESGDAQSGLAYMARALRRNHFSEPILIRLAATLNTHFPASLALQPIKHKGAINQICFSPDSKNIATASDDHTARVWDLKTGEPVSPPWVHGREVVRVAFAPNGKMLATASLDKSAGLWDVYSGEAVCDPFIFSDYVQTIQFTQNGTELYMMGRDGDARFWNLESKSYRENWNLQTNQSYAIYSQSNPDGSVIGVKTRNGLLLADIKAGVVPVNQLIQEPVDYQSQWRLVSIKLSKDSQLAVTTLQKDYVEIWSVQDQAKLYRIPHDEIVCDAQFSPDGIHLATACQDGSVRIWDISEEPRVTRVLRLSDQAILLEYNQDGSRLLVADAQEALTWWDPKEGILLQAGMRHPAQIHNYSIAISPDNSMVAAGLSNGETWVWRIQEPERPEAIEFIHEGKINSVRFSPDGRRVVTASNDKTVRIWNVESGSMLNAPGLHDGLVMHAEFSPDGEKIVTSSYDYNVRIFDSETLDLLMDPILARGWTLKAHFSLDGNKIFAPTYPHFARFWNVEDGSMIGDPFKVEAYPRDIDFSAKRNWMAIASSSYRAQIWSVEPRLETPIRELPHGARVHSVKFTQDGSALLTASADNAVRLWDLDTFEPELPEMMHDGVVVSSNFSRDETKIISASKDNTARIWDAVTGESVVPPLQHDGDVNAAVFGPQGKWALTASDDGYARLWDVASGIQVTEATHHEGPVTDIRISPDGAYYVSVDATGKGILRKIPKRPDVNEPIPDWIPALAEAMGGFRLNENNVLTRIPTSERVTRIQTIRKEVDESELRRWGMKSSWLTRLLSSL